MILDRLDMAQRYCSLHPGFRPAFEFLRSADLAELSLGRHDVVGDRLFVLVARGVGQGRAGAKLETHRRYIDIQLALGSNDEIGWRPTSTCERIATPFDADKDIMFFADAPQTWLTLAPGNFVIFFPDDAHAPLAIDGELRKIVVKIAVNWP